VDRFHCYGDRAMLGLIVTASELPDPLADENTKFETKFYVLQIEQELLSRISCNEITRRPSLLRRVIALCNRLDSSMSPFITASNAFRSSVSFTFDWIRLKISPSILQKIRRARRTTSTRLSNFFVRKHVAHSIVAERAFHADFRPE
jgi:hypothetical protein